jgi:hypothetical protein
LIDVILREMRGVVNDRETVRTCCDGSSKTGERDESIATLEEQIRARRPRPEISRAEASAA